MKAYGTRVVAGVTPGKGGQEVEGVSVYNSVALALKSHPEVSATLVAVPAPFVLDAALEAIFNKIPLVNILTDKVPVAHVAEMVQKASLYGVRVVGPSSIGIISPGKAKLGSIGSGDVAHRVFMKGSIGVISKSGGMTAEVSRILTDAGLGQSTAVGIGGDLLLGSDFLDLAREFEKDKETKVLVIFGEVGGVFEERLAGAMKEGTIRKPVVALIAGQFSQNLPQDTVLGHAGAIVSRGRGSAASKIRALQAAGALIAPTPEHIPELVKKVLKK
jgi:succinyl-CoA synthetase alpha subunit